VAMWLSAAIFEPQRTQRSQRPAQRISFQFSRLDSKKREKLRRQILFTPFLQKLVAGGRVVGGRHEFLRVGGGRGRDEKGSSQAIGPPARPCRARARAASTTRAWLRRARRERPWPQSQIAVWRAVFTHRERDWERDPASLAATP
jgi:hypothetical protein